MKKTLTLCEILDMIENQTKFSYSVKLPMVIPEPRYIPISQKDGEWRFVEWE